MYTSPKAGQRFPAQENTTVKNPGPNAGTDAMNEWLQAQAQDQAFRVCQRLIADYQNQFLSSWLINYRAGRVFGPAGMGDPDAPPLQPPHGWEVEVKDAEAGGIYFDLSEGSAPVCSVPLYFKIQAPQVPGSGKIKTDVPASIASTDMVTGAVKPGTTPALTAAEQPDAYKRAHGQHR